MPLPYLLPDPITPATFRSAAPLGAGRMQLLSSNAQFLAAANAQRNLVNHPGVRSFNVNPFPGYSFYPPAPSSVRWEIAVKNGGCAICLGAIVIPGPFPGFPTFALCLRARARAQSAGQSTGIVFALTPGDTSITAGGPSAFTGGFVTSTAFTDVSTQAGSLAGIPGLGMVLSAELPSQHFAPVLSVGTQNEQGDALFGTLWMGGWVTSGLGDILGISVALVPPSEIP